MTVAIMETDHFTFVSLGNNRQDAMKRLKAAWGRHRKQTGATFTWNEAIEYYSPYTLDGPRVYRDGMEC